MKIDFEKEFQRLASNFSDTKSAMVMGSITEDVPYPAVGVTGDAFLVLCLISALIRKFAEHVHESPESVIGTIYEIIQEVQKADEVKADERS